MHSFDILLSEFICVFNWYNPFSWMLRHAIRQNLEFIADEQVLQKGLDRKTDLGHPENGGFLRRAFIVADD